MTTTNGKAPGSVQGTESRDVSPIEERPLDYSTLLAARDMLRRRLTNQNDANITGRLNTQIAHTHYLLTRVNALIEAFQNYAVRQVEAAFPFTAPKSPEPAEGWCQDPWQMKEVG